MKGFIYQIHIFLGVLVAIPVLAWALSGLMYALPGAVEGGVTENIDIARVAVTPVDAMAKANELAGTTLPTTALTLLMKDGRPQYQSIGGLGADSIFIDAETGEARMSGPQPLRTSIFRHAHFYYFAGGWQVVLLVLFSALASLSALTGLYLNIVHWSRRMSPRRRRYLSS
jgi:uncharacterized iron-regulated membrane protein